ncbi:hypothetical protein MPRS_19200 [Mycobacterium paraseoulense]|nr:hypothetical protein MPRS_19200 [Mycobacterium paraseoulense]
MTVPSKVASKGTCAWPRYVSIGRGAGAAPGGCPDAQPASDKARHMLATHRLIVEKRSADARRTKTPIGPPGPQGRYSRGANRRIRSDYGAR